MKNEKNQTICYSYIIYIMYGYEIELVMRRERDRDDVAKIW